MTYAPYGGYAQEPYAGAGKLGCVWDQTLNAKVELNHRFPGCVVCVPRNPMLVLDDLVVFGIKL
jgi:hypothetical protein